MGLFAFFGKKKKPVLETQEPEIPDDFNPLDIGSVIRYIKKRKPGISDKEAWEIFYKACEPAKDQDHLTPEGELPYGWYYVHKDFIEKIESEYNAIADKYFDSRNKGVLNEFSALKAYVAYMKDVKKLCCTKGECYAFWSSICVARPDTIQFMEEELQNMESNLDELLKTERIMNKLRTELPKVINAQPGILQTDTYKLYDSDIKPHITETLRLMDREGLITREKSGRTYSLFPKQ